MQQYYHGNTRFTVIVVTVVLPTYWLKNIPNLITQCYSFFWCMFNKKWPGTPSQHNSLLCRHSSCTLRTHIYIHIIRTTQCTNIMVLVIVQSNFNENCYWFIAKQFTQMSLMTKHLSTPVTTRKALSRGIMKSQYESTRRTAILLNAIIGRQGSNMYFVFVWIFCFTDLQSVPPNPSTPWYTVACNQRVQIISSKFVNILTNILLTNSSKHIISMFRN